MSEYHKTVDDLNEHLRQECAAIDYLIEGYKSGKTFLAAGLARHVNTLVYDPTPSGRKHRPSQSLLGQMAAKDSIQYLSSRNPLPKTVIPWVPLVTMTANETSNFRFLPIFDGARAHWRWLPFGKWWEEEVFLTPEGRALSRKNLVFSLRDQDGGGHIDQILSNAEYIMLRQIADPRVVRIKNRPCGEKKPEVKFYLSLAEAKRKTSPDEEPIPGAHFATMCQVAWELRQSINSLLGAPAP